MSVRAVMVDVITHVPTAMEATAAPVMLDMNWIMIFTLAMVTTVYCSLSLTRLMCV